MSRVVLTDGSGRWLDTDKAQRWEEETRWNGRNHVSLATGSQWEHETLYRSGEGVYVLHHWSQWQGSVESYEEVTVETAANWLSRNGYLEGDAEAAGAAVAEAYRELEIR